MRDKKSFSDADLITAIRTGDELDAAIGFVYRTHYRMLENYILANSGNEMDAEDIVQEALVSFIEMVQKGKFRGEASVKSFLFTLTRNLWITQLRKKGSDAKRNTLFEMTSDKIEEDVTSYLAYKEAQKTITDLLDRLGERCRQILELFYYENLSMKDILKKTNYDNEQVLRNRKYKCLKELTEMIQQSPALSDTVKSALQSFK